MNLKTEEQMDKLLDQLEDISEVDQKVRQDNKKIKD